MYKLRTVALIIFALALLVAALGLFANTILTLEWKVSWDVWVVLTALGTVGATVVAVALAIGANRNARTETANLVSAWVTDEFIEKSDGSSYERRSTLHVANESNEPVFRANVGVYVGNAKTALGPLSAPSPIAVLPARRELTFDISIPLLAHTDNWSPEADIYFVDARSRHWQRELDGSLKEVTGKKQKWSRKQTGLNELQLGNTSTSFNPMIVVLEFLAELRKKKDASPELKSLLDTQASGWGAVDFQKLCEDTARYTPTTMVDYQAPRIARVKLSGDVALEGKYVQGDGAPISLADVIFITLTLNPELGWRIFGIGGPVRTEDIFFGNLHEPINPHGVGGAI